MELIDIAINLHILALERESPEFGEVVVKGIHHSFDTQMQAKSLHEQGNQDRQWVPIIDRMRE